MPANDRFGCLSQTLQVFLDLAGLQGPVTFRLVGHQPGRKEEFLLVGHQPGGKRNSCWWDTSREGKGIPAGEYRAIMSPE